MGIVEKTVPFWHCEWKNCGYEWIKRSDTLPRSCPGCGKHGWFVGTLQSTSRKKTKAKIIRHRGTVLRPPPRVKLPTRWPAAKILNDLKAFGSE